MNVKLAKAIRKELHYHPQDVRRYVRLNPQHKTLTLDERDSRVLYKEMKKEAKRG